MAILQLRIRGLTRLRFLYQVRGARALVLATPQHKEKIKRMNNIRLTILHVIILTRHLQSLAVPPSTTPKLYVKMSTLRQTP